MTAFDSRTPEASPLDPAAVKAAFARCFSIDDPEQRAEALQRLERDSPRIAAEVRSLLEALQSSEKVEQVSAYVPLLDLSLVKAAEPLDDVSPSQDFSVSDPDASGSPQPTHPSVLRSMEQTLADVPHVVLKCSGGEEPVVKVRSSEADHAWNKQGGRYRLDGEIARGGMGAILKGRDTDLGRDLAVKVLLKEHHENPETVKRFIEEAQIGGQLQHPGIAPVYEMGQFADERPYFTMKLIKGKTLAALLHERQTVDDDRAKYLGIFEQICQTMAYAHSRGVLHRDLKPSNVMVGAFGEVQVMDWGLAKVLAAGGVADEAKQTSEPQLESLIQTVRSTSSDSTYKDQQPAFGSATRMGSILGTPGYMSPEQATGEIDRLDQRADVFALGSILCEILTGDPAYRPGDHVDQLILARRGDTADALERLDSSSADRELVRLAKDCLALDRSKRPIDAQAVSERVSRYLESVDQRLRETELEVARSNTKAAEERKRRRVVVALAASIVLAVMLGTGGWAGVQEKEAELAQIQADNALAKSTERSELEQRIQAELAAAEALADSSPRLPEEHELERARESLDDAQQDLEGQTGLPELAKRLKQLRAQVSQQQADLKFFRSLQEIWEREQQYFAEKNLPSVFHENIHQPAPDSRQNTALAGTGNPAALYEKAFHEWGFSPREAAPNDLLSRVKRVPTEYQDAVIASLNRWRQLLSIDYSLVDWTEQKWSSLQPIEGRSNWGDQFRILEDRSVLVSGPGQYRGYEILLETESTELSALRLEALLHESLPNQGPGRSQNGNFDVKDLTIAVASRTNPKDFAEVEISAGAANFSDPDFPFKLDRWRSGGGGRPQVAFFQLSESIYNPDGFRIKVAIRVTRDQALSRVGTGGLGRFRWSTTRLEDPSPLIAALESLLGIVDRDPWRRRLRHAIKNSDIRGLIQLGTDSESIERQPAVLCTELANQLLSVTGAEMERLLLDSTDFRVVYSPEVTSEQGTRYQVADDGTLNAHGPIPESEVTTIVIPANVVRPDTSVIQIELLTPNEEPFGAYLGRRRYVRLNEVAITQQTGDITRHIAGRMFANYPFAYSLARAMDEKLDTCVRVPWPDCPRTFYAVLDPETFMPGEPISIKLHTGIGSESGYNDPHPTRIRTALGARKDPSINPSFAAGQLLKQLIDARPKDPLVHLRLASYYAVNAPARTADALRHATIAGTSLNDSIAASLVFADVLEPETLIDNAPFRQLAKKHIQRVEKYYPANLRTRRLNLAMVGAVVSNYARGEYSRAEQLMEFGLASFSDKDLFLSRIFTSLSWDDLNEQRVCHSLIGSIKESVPAGSDKAFVSANLNRLGLVFRKAGKLERALQIAEATLEAVPDDVTGHKNLAASLMRLERFDEASKTWKEATELDPGNPVLYGFLGRSLFRQGQTQKAFDAFDKSAELALENAKNFHLIAGTWLVSRKSRRMEEILSVADGKEETLTHQGRPIGTLQAVQAVQEGIAHLEKALSESPDDLDIRQELAKSYYRLGNWQEAVKRFEEIEAIANHEYDRDRYSYFLLAMAHWQLGHSDLAGQHFGRGSAWVDTHKMRDAECQRIRKEAASVMQLDSRDKARLRKQGYALWLDEVNSAVDWDTADYRPWLYRGAIYHYMGLFQEAAADFSRAIELNPLDSDSIGWRLGIYRELGQFESALADANRVVELQPWFNARYFDRADIQRELGNFQQAIADIKKGFQVNPTSESHWFSRARARKMAGDIYQQHLKEYGNAIEQYDKALQLDPDHFDALLDRAYANAKLGNYAQSLADVERACTLDSEGSRPFSQAKARMRAGLMYRDRLHRNVEALEQFDKAIELDPDNSFVWSARAHTLLLLGQHKAALSDIERALVVDASQYHAHRVRSLIHLELEQLDQALEARTQGIASRPDKNLGYFERAWLYHRRGEFEAALADIENGLRVDPDTDNRMFTRARAYQLAGDIYLHELDQPANAVEQYDKAIVLDPDDSELQQKRDEATQALQDG